MDDLRWLLCTHHLLDYSGSEVVTLELAEELLLRGCHVSLFAPVQDSEFISQAAPDGAIVISDKSKITLRQVDAVYCQHQSISLLLADHDPDFLLSASRPVFVYNHLSPFEPFEAPGPFAEERFADIVLCNSIETQRSLNHFGTFFEKATVFPNPAPRRFSASPRPRPAKLNRLISVSNHPPEELSAAFEILEAEGVEVTKIGRRNGQKRLTLQDLTDNDAVVTIGKTVQYAIRASVPVFCYDHFAGPGWLTKSNFNVAASANFSGRCNSRKRTPEELSREIREGFIEADDFSHVPEQYRLERMVDQLIQSVRVGAENRVPIAMEAQDLKGRLERERSVYELVNREYRSKRTLKKRLDAATARENLLPEAQVALDESRRGEIGELKRNLRDARLRPLKSLRRKWLARFMYFLAGREHLLSQRQRDRFRNSARKRDPLRDDIAIPDRRLE